MVLLTRDGHELAQGDLILYGDDIFEVTEDGEKVKMMKCINCDVVNGTYNLQPPAIEISQKEASQFYFLG